MTFLTYSEISLKTPKGFRLISAPANGLRPFGNPTRPRFTCPWNLSTLPGDASQRGPHESRFLIAGRISIIRHPLNEKPGSILG